MKLILFDIDNTLVDVLRFQNRAFEKAIKKVFGFKGSLEELPYFGAAKSVKENIRDLCEIHKVKKKEIFEKLEEAANQVEANLIWELERREEEVLLPGIEYLVDRLYWDGNLLGIVTGNSLNAAIEILEEGNIREYFSIFACGDEALDRVGLIKLAIERAQEKVKRQIPKNQIILIGDSKRDIKAGKEVGIKTVAVATGATSLKELKEAGPDLLFEDFSNWGKAFSLIKKL